MPKRGYKAGGGRPRQANTRRSLMEKGRQAMAAVEAPEASDETSAPAQHANLDPLAYMLRVMNDPGAEPERRDRVAIAAPPFMHSRATGVAKGKKELQAERAKAAASGRFTPPPPPKLVA